MKRLAVAILSILLLLAATPAWAKDDTSQVPAGPHDRRPEGQDHGRAERGRRHGPGPPTGCAHARASA